MIDGSYVYEVSKDFCMNLDFKTLFNLIFSSEE